MAPQFAPTRRAFVGGGLAAAAWRLAPARAETPAPPSDGIRTFEAAPFPLALLAAAGGAGRRPSPMAERSRGRCSGSKRAKS